VNPARGLLATNAPKPKPYTSGQGWHKGALFETGNFDSEERHEGWFKSPELEKSKPSFKLFSEARHLLLQFLDVFA